MQFEPCIPVPFEDNDLLEEYVGKAKAWLLQNGFGMHLKDDFSRDTITFLPFTLLPSTFPAVEFKKAKMIQSILNKLMHKVAHNGQFLRETLSETITVDPFMARLLQIHNTVLEEGLTQKVSLGLFRSDYMIDSLTDGTIKQVEFNTIACGSAAASYVLEKWHRNVVTLLGFPDRTKNMPLSDALHGYANAILTAHEHYIKESGSKTAAILIVIEDRTLNIGDQRLVEFEILKLAPSVRTIRKSITNISNTMRLDERRRLYINDFEIGVVYYRAGYSPDFYHSEVEWNVRLQLERSLAIKCPSIQYQLAGSKKIQQQLALSGVVERFLSEPEEVEAVRQVFTGLYSLDMNDPISNEMIKRAINNPSVFVLKPQREGGGNNLFNEAITKRLLEIQNSDERHGWILMDRIQPPSVLNYMIRKGEEPIFTGVVGELGIFGVIMGDSENIILNSEVGHMLRSKENSTNECGLIEGRGALDSVYLTTTDSIHC